MEIISDAVALKSNLMLAAALPWEARCVCGGLTIVQSETERGWTLTRTLPRPGIAVDVLTTGMGQSRAGDALAWALARSRPAAIVSLGCAGALDPPLRAGDVVVATEIRVGGSTAIESDAAWRERLERAAEASGLHAVSGALLTTSAILASAADKREARATSAALAVEMEAGALGDGARDAGIPFAAVRAILDLADEEITFARDLVGDDGRLRVGALLAALLRGRTRAVHELRALATARRACASSLELLSRALFERLVANEKALG